ncbi:MAG: tail fiber domain-containing protein [Dysgonamonadaceae bacterium]|nr:tail fiber domain-containing protein [Dysgonamonadaceae bacterium]
MGTAIGVQGECVVDFSHYSANAIGVLGVAGGYSGENSAVKGILRGSNGVGIFGSVDSESPSVLGKFAGYFDGNVLVTGTINGVTISSSDIRFKKNIAEMESRKALNNVLLMKPIEYNLEQRYVEKEDKGIAKKYPVYNEKSQLFQKKHYGLIAQELQELYPDLVYEDDNGYLAVNYTGLIPVLVQSIQELNREVETLRSATALSNPAATGASLSQNTPNPFTGQTQIRYYLPATVGTAVLCVYDMQGKQLKQYPLAQRGEGIQNISGSEFAAGIYLYALVADGKEVDVKRMILTE